MSAKNAFGPRRAAEQIRFATRERQQKVCCNVSTERHPHAARSRSF